MKFTTNAKPLAEALNLGIIDSNVSNYYKRSCITQLTANADTLTINVESSRIRTEIRIKGSGEGEPAKAFVDSLLFKKLINTLESTVTFEFEENGIRIQSGKSKFSIGNSFGDAVDSMDFSLSAPDPISSDVEFTDVDKYAWKFIKDNQMYAISTSFTFPVYTKVWVGEHGDVLVGDFEDNRFTHSKKSNLGATCLLSDTIINLFNSIPETSKIARVGNDYVIRFSKDSYEYVTQFTPQYESEEDVGSYKSDIFLNKMKHPDSFNRIIPVSVTKLLNQAKLLAPSGINVIKMTVKDNMMSLDDNNVHGQIEIEGDPSIEYSLLFKLDELRQVINNYGDQKISIAPIMGDGFVIGICVWSDDMTTIYAGCE